MRLVPITPPPVEPLTLAYAKLHLRVTSNDQDDIITPLITVARRRIERETGRALVQQTWELQMERFPHILPFDIRLPLPPLRSVTSVKYRDVNGVEQSVSTALYRVIADGDLPAIIRPVDDWPNIYTTDDAFPYSVRVRFVCGYAPTAASPINYVAHIPEELRQAMLLLVGHHFENREQVILTPSRQELQSLPLGVDALISPYRVRKLY